MFEHHDIYTYYSPVSKIGKSEIMHAIVDFNYPLK